MCFSSCWKKNLDALEHDDVTGLLVFIWYQYEWSWPFFTVMVARYLVLFVLQSFKYTWMCCLDMLVWFYIHYIVFIQVILFENSCAGTSDSALKQTLLCTFRTAPGKSLAVSPPSSKGPNLQRGTAIRNTFHGTKEARRQVQSPYNGPSGAPSHTVDTSAMGPGGGRPSFFNRITQKFSRRWV